MAHFAKINENNFVEQVIVVNNEILIDEDGVEQETLGIQFCEELIGGRWIQTSYNSKFRGMYAAPGMFYDEATDEFKYPEIVNESETI